MLLTRLAGLAVARRRLVLVATALFLALAGALGGGVAAELSGGGFDDPDAKSVRAAQVLEQQFGSGTPNLVLLVRAPQGVDDPAAVAAGTVLTQRLAAEEGVAQVVSWWTAGRPDAFQARDGSSAIVLARLTGADDAMVTRVEELAPEYRGEFRGLDVEVGGIAQTFSQVGSTIERDILRAEAIAVPITMVLLVLVFGSAVAAGLPLLVGVLSILGTFLVLHLLAKVTDVSVYSVNLATSLGLGLGIDYSLFMVSRHREELARGLASYAAVVTTVRTAGRTVLFSALTVLLSLSALLVFPLYFLRSFAYAGIAAVVFAAVGAVLVLPAALAALGPRVDALDLRRPLRRLLRLPEPRPAALDHGFWSRIAHGVMRRPVPVATSVIALLVVAAAARSATSSSPCRRASRPASSRASRSSWPSGCGPPRTASPRCWSPSRTSRGRTWTPSSTARSAWPASGWPPGRGSTRGCRCPSSWPGWTGCAGATPARSAAACRPSSRPWRPSSSSAA